jgi:hypothetical protein
MLSKKELDERNRQWKLGHNARTKANAQRNLLASQKRRDRLIAVLLLLGYVKQKQPFTHRGETPGLYRYSHSEFDVTVRVFQKKAEYMLTVYPNVSAKSYRMPVQNMAHFVIKYAGRMPDV